jgi:hypothetical protein
MARKLVLAFFIVLCLWGKSDGQSLTMDKFTNQLFFNIFKEQPDASFQDFLKANIPVLLEKKIKDAVWVANPNKNNQEAHEEIHSYIFYKHPFFKSSFTAGKMEFFTYRSKENNAVLISNLKLWFEFDSQPDAEVAFSNLIESFIPISTAKKFSSTNGAQRAEFSDNKETKGFGKIRIRLTADNLDKHIFKILIETENEL